MSVDNAAAAAAAEAAAETEAAAEAELEAATAKHIASNKRRLDSFLQSIGSWPSTPQAPPRPDTTGSMDAAPAATKRQRLGSLYASEALQKWTSASSSKSSITSERTAAGRSSILAVGNPAASTSTTSVSTAAASVSTTAEAAAAAPSSASSSSPLTAGRFNPYDRDGLLRRLATFQVLTDWTPKPDRICDIAWARRGWSCMGRERVSCVLCRNSLMVYLAPREDGRWPIGLLFDTDLDKALVDKYVSIIVEGHAKGCPWRGIGSHDTLLRVPLSRHDEALPALRERYDEIAGRADVLPYEFNLRLPPELDLDLMVDQLGPDFFASPSASGLSSAPPTGHDRVALALALTGWQRLVMTGSPQHAVRNLVSCHACLRRLGLWIFRSREVGPDGRTVITPALMGHLDPIAEHRFFCPWKNAAAQRIGLVHKPASDVVAWRRLVEIIHCQAEIRDASAGRSDGFLNRARTRAQRSAPSTPAGRGGSGSGLAGEGGRKSIGDMEEYKRESAIKDNIIYTRLSRIKSLFLPPGSIRRSFLARAKSRPSSQLVTSDPIEGTTETTTVATEPVAVATETTETAKTEAAVKEEGSGSGRGEAPA